MTSTESCSKCYHMKKPGTVEPCKSCTARAGNTDVQGAVNNFRPQERELMSSKLSLNLPSAMMDVIKAESLRRDRPVSYIVREKLQQFYG